MRSITKALYALTCLLGLLSLAVGRLDWWRHFAGAEHRFVYRMLMCTSVSFALVYPIAAVLVMRHWPVKGSDLRNSLLFVSLVLLFGAWFSSSLGLVGFLVMGPDFD